ncbi:hypothetical protein [Insolitispirillum peregrinum]|uniref:hypothetical protein n=1 Tax=Insolitispirillum peregrinum TaxID=80876 RepID=UPI00361C3C3D
MSLSTESLTRQEEDLPAPDYIAEEQQDPYDDGNWPELAGLLATAVVFWLLFAFTG